MNFTKAFSLLSLLLALTLFTANNNSGRIAAGDETTSSPAVQTAPNGDRVSQYPPYFHPTE
jgi:hypothetical protein